MEESNLLSPFTTREMYLISLLELKCKWVSGSDEQSIEPWNLSDGTTRSSPTEADLQSLLKNIEAQLWKDVPSNEYLCHQYGFDDTMARFLRQKAKDAIVDELDNIEKTKIDAQEFHLYEILQACTKWNMMFSDIARDLEALKTGKLRATAEGYKLGVKRKADIARLTALTEIIAQETKKLQAGESATHDFIRSPFEQETPKTPSDYLDFNQQD